MNWTLREFISSLIFFLWLKFRVLWSGFHVDKICWNDKVHVCFFSFRCTTFEILFLWFICLIKWVYIFFEKVYFKYSQDQAQKLEFHSTIRQSIVVSNQSILSEFLSEYWNNTESIFINCSLRFLNPQKVWHRN